MKLYIDADGCPVVNASVLLASRYRVECILLCDTSHRLEKPGATTITVSKGNDSVDFALVNLLSAGDIVITQDYGLAAMCLARKATVLNQDGQRYTGENIDSLLSARHTARKIRMAGGRLRGQPKRTAQQDLSFAKALEPLLQIQSRENREQ